MINTYLENDRAVFHITTSQILYRHIISVFKKSDSVYAYGCQGSAPGRLFLPLTASILTYFITGWIENLYSQATLIRKLQPAKLEKNQNYK